MISSSSRSRRSSARPPLPSRVCAVFEPPPVSVWMRAAAFVKRRCLLCGGGVMGAWRLREGARLVVWRRRRGYQNSTFLPFGPGVPPHAGNTQDGPPQRLAEARLVVWARRPVRVNVDLPSVFPPGSTANNSSTEAVGYILVIRSSSERLFGQKWRPAKYWNLVPIDLPAVFARL